jgi:hypothetical protein
LERKAAVVAVSVSPSSVLEDGTANLVYTFSRSGSTTSALTVNFSVGGTATYNTDYTQSGAASFIGASVEQFEFVKESQAVLVNGREFAGPLNVVRKATLGEISFVDLGADGETSARLAASAKEKAVMEATKTDKQNETVTAAAGKEMATVPVGTDLAPAPAKVEVQAAPVVKADVPAGGGVTTTSSADTVAGIRAEAAAEEERIAAVRKVCGSDHADISAKALREGWDVTRTELEVLRADRPKAPAAHPRLFPPGKFGERQDEQAYRTTDREGAGRCSGHPRADVLAAGGDCRSRARRLSAAAAYRTEDGEVAAGRRGGVPGRLGRRQALNLRIHILQ